MSDKKPKRFTRKQRAWLKLYQQVTGFDVLNKDDYLNGRFTFLEFVLHNAKWFEDWANDSLHMIDQWPMREKGTSQ